MIIFFINELHRNGLIPAGVQQFQAALIGLGGKTLVPVSLSFYQVSGSIPAYAIILDVYFKYIAGQMKFHL